MRGSLSFICVILTGFLGSCSAVPHYDTIIRHGTIYDGTGAPGQIGDVAISGDRVAAVGDIGDATGAAEIDATGMAVAPGFINMLSQSASSLMQDGRSARRPSPRCHARGLGRACDWATESPDATRTARGAVGYQVRGYVVDCG